MLLREYLNKRNHQLAEQIKSIVDRAIPQLWHTYATFPSGTRHTSEHTMMVEKIAGHLYSRELLDELTDDEIAFLILACHFHDLGMAGTEDDNQDATTREQVRREHAVSVGNRIRLHWRAFGFQNENDSQVLGEICRGHRPNKVSERATWDDLDQLSIIGPDRTVRPRLIAAMIYAADELHLGEDRAPAREEEFGEIKSLESLRHWRRHQSINGPAVVDGKLQFDVNIKTIASEIDLRQAISKAIDALHDLKIQLSTHGIKTSVPYVSMNFKRSDLWSLLVVQVCDDLIPRSERDIVQLVQEQFSSSTREAIDIALCNAPFDTAAAEKEVLRAISNFKTRSFLAAKDGNLTLQLSRKAGEYFLDLAKFVDKFDSAFENRDQPSHEYRLYKSSYGKEYLTSYLFPEWEHKFQSPFSNPLVNEPLKTVLQYSPTAARVAHQVSPPPSVMAHTDLLEFSAVAGVCADLLNDPELILDTYFRKSVDTLFFHAAGRLAEFLRFTKELAIINRLNFDELTEMISPADEPEWSSDQQVVSLSISQQFPVNKKHWSISNVWLASIRAGMHVTVHNTWQAPFKLREKDQGKISESDSRGITSEDPIAISFGPSSPLIVPKISLRLGIDYDRSAKSIRIFGGQLTNNDSNKCLSVAISTRQPNKQSAVCQIVHSEWSVGDFEAMQSYTKDGETQIIFDVKGFTDISEFDFGQSEDNKVYTDAILRLATVNPELPMPLFLKEEVILAITTGTEGEIKDKLERYAQEHSTNLPIFTAITLRFSTLEGVDYYEEFLGFCPLNMRFNCPAVNGPEVVQNKLEKAWETGIEELKLTSYSKKGFEELASILRSWSKDPDSEFPLEFSNDGPKLHFANTRIDLVFHPIRNRFWFRQRDVTLRLYPVSRAQRYGIEKEYWENVRKDSQRTEMLEEMFQQAAAEEHAKGLDTVARSIHPEKGDDLSL